MGPRSTSTADSTCDVHDPAGAELRGVARLSEPALSGRQRRGVPRRACAARRAGRAAGCALLLAAGRPRRARRERSARRRCASSARRPASRPRSSASTITSRSSSGTPRAAWRRHFVVASFVGRWLSGEAATGPEALRTLWIAPDARRRPADDAAAAAHPVPGGRAPGGTVTGRPLGSRRCAASPWRLVPALAAAQVPARQPAAAARGGSRSAGGADRRPRRAAALRAAARAPGRTARHAGAAARACAGTATRRSSAAAWRRCSRRRRRPSSRRRDGWRGPSTAGSSGYAAAYRSCTPSARLVIARA